MAFDPDAYLAEKTQPAQASGVFDPDAYLSAKGAQPVQQPQESAKPQTLLERFKASQIARSAGLAARAGIEGAGDVIGIVQNPLSAMTGGAIRKASSVYPELATSVGLPEPDTGTERLAGAGMRGLVGAGSMTGLGSALANAPRAIGAMGSALSASPVAQSASGITGAVAPEIVRQAGGDERAQMAAGVIGALSPTAIAQLAPKLGGKIADVIGTLGTHTGGEPIRQAAKAGLRGGEAQASFIENMRGNVPVDDVLATAKQNLQNMAAAKASEYRANMAGVKSDKTILSLDPIGEDIAKAYNQVTFKGQIKNAKGADVLKKISDAVGDWKELNPAEFHTPEGLDALKQSIGGIVESIPFEEKTARMVGTNIYNSIKNEITKQAPVYAKTMKQYSDASEQIKEIEKALSLGNKASQDTAMRKLQSLMRNNVNTNYGKRLELAKSLESQGGNEILPALAGQALNTITPRGLGGAVAGGLGMGGYALGGPALAVPILAGQSPRLMGEIALKAGQVGRGLTPLAEQDRTNALARALLYGGMGANQ
jgi:hypothetical protein